MNFLVWLVIIVANSIALANGGNILVLSPFSTKSHKISFMPVVEALAIKGHQITVVSPYQSDKQVPNVEEIIIQNFLDESDIDHFEFRQLESWWKAAEVFIELREMTNMVYDNLMTNVQFQQILQQPRVDLVILDAIFNDFCLPIIEHLNVPFIYYSPTGGLPWTLKSMGASLELASIPTIYQCIECGHTEMNFYRRMLNFLSTMFTLEARKWFFLPTLDNHVKKDFPNARSIASIERDASLAFINHHPTTSFPQPFPPTVIPLPALHIRPTQPLPQYLQEYADQCWAHGLIIFSLGSAIKSTTLPKQHLHAFVDAFSKIQQCIVWKWEEDTVPGLSSNVLLVNWLPQQDLLGHKNVKLLISHGGLLSLQEAIYHGVPVLGLPFYTEQQLNMVKTVKEGAGIKLLWEELNADVLKQTIVTLITQSIYKSNATRLSNLMRDELIPTKDLAVYSIEHVLRFGGTKHLKLASIDMPVYKLYFIDVFVVAIVGFLLFASLCRLTFQRIYKLFLKIIKFVSFFNQFSRTYPCCKMLSKIIFHQI